MVGVQTAAETRPDRQIRRVRIGRKRSKPPTLVGRGLLWCGPNSGRGGEIRDVVAFEEVEVSRGGCPFQDVPRLGREPDQERGSSAKGPVESRRDGRVGGD